MPTCRHSSSKLRKHRLKPIRPSLRQRKPNLLTALFAHEAIQSRTLEDMRLRIEGVLFNSPARLSSNRQL
jgi:hypothetical protein